MKKTQVVYSVHPAVAMVQKWISDLKAKTGRSLEEWLALIEQSAPEGERERRDWLKAEHGMGTNSAAWLAGRSMGKEEETDSPEAYLAAAERYVDNMFRGPKAALRPLFEQLLRIGMSLGPDVKVCPCQTMVPLYRRHVFAQIKPSTQTRVDLGLALGARKGEGRLIETGGYLKRDRITHRIAICTSSDIDDVVKRWLALAYREDAGATLNE